MDNVLILTQRNGGYATIMNRRTYLKNQILPQKLQGKD